MKSSRRIIAVLIIGVAVAAAGFIVKKGGAGNPRVAAPEKYQPLAVNNESTSSHPPMQGEIPTAGDPIAPPKDTARSPENLTGNATAALAKKIADELIKKNPEGPSSDGASYQIKALDPETTASQFMNEALAEITPEEFFPEADVNRIKIASSEVSPLTLSGYRETIGKIFHKNYLVLPPVGNRETFMQDFSRLARAAENTLGELYALEVPKELVTLHIKEIALVAAQERIFDAVENMNIDPLRALVALQLLPDTMEQFASLQKQNFP